MLNQKRKIAEKHIKTHSEHSNEDRAAVSVLETFLRSDGKIFYCFQEHSFIGNIIEHLSAFLYNGNRLKTVFIRTGIK